MVNGVWGKVFMPGSFVASEFAQLAVEPIQRRIEVGWLAGLWNSYDCSEKKVTATDPITIGAGGRTDGMQKVCGLEWWKISFDGGRTWYDVQVEVCRYYAE